MKHTIVFIYNSYGDPLFQNLMLTYIKTLRKKNVGKFYLITFEQEVYRLPRNEKIDVTKSLRKEKIYWYPLKYHTGRLLLLKKLWDVLQGFMVVSFLRVFKRAGIILCFANVSGTFGYLFSRILQIRLYVYSYEPHSEFMADLGHWSRNSLKFKLLNWLEWKVGMKADVIMTGTKWMVEELQRRGSKAKLYRAPTAVDPERFQFKPEARKKLRKALGYTGEDVVFIYLGKFGGLYYTTEIPFLCRQLKDSSRIPDFKLLIITPDDHSIVKALCNEYLVDDDFIIVGPIYGEQLVAYLSVGDFGISGVPPTPAQRYRSPTKIAEYMLIGMPYITAKGISEDDIYAEHFKVGAVIPDFGKQPDKNFFYQLDQLIAEEANKRRSRIRKVGLEYRSKDKIDQILSELYH
jgi:hypothetical protein